MDIEQLRRQLSAIEPDESMYDGISSADIPASKQLLSEPEPWLASRAVWGLAYLNTAEAVRRLDIAARDSRPEVRVSVAASARRLSPRFAEPLLVKLLDDSDIGVRKFSVLSASSRSSSQLIEKLKTIANSDVHVDLRRFAQEKLDEMGAHRQ